MGFGLAVAVAVLGAAMVRLALRRPGFDLASSAAIVLLALWTVCVTAWTLPVSAARWLAFADGLGHLVLALGILLRRALSDEHLVHVLEVRELRPR
jgi:hypothetical protein